MKNKFKDYENRKLTEAEKEELLDYVADRLKDRKTLFPKMVEDAKNFLQQLKLSELKTSQ